MQKSFKSSRIYYNYIIVLKVWYTISLAQQLYHFRSFYIISNVILYLYM